MARTQKLTVNEIIPLDDAKVPLPKGLRIRIPLRAHPQTQFGALQALFHDARAKPKYCSTSNARAISWW